MSKGEAQDEGTLLMIVSKGEPEVHGEGESKRGEERARET